MNLDREINKLYRRNISSIKGSGSGYKRPRKNEKRYM